MAKGNISAEQQHKGKQETELVYHSVRRGKPNDTKGLVYQICSFVVDAKYEDMEAVKRREKGNFVGKGYRGY